MSIDPTQPLKPVASVQSRETSTPKSRSTPERSGVTSPQVRLSNMQARLIQATESDINVQRVAELKLAIQRGELTMDTGKIADALLQNAQDLLQD